ncbi:BA14K family protein [Microvirga zambiensis]
MPHAGSVQTHAFNCSQRFRTYDPGSNTFMGNDGHRHACR